MTTTQSINETQLRIRLQQSGCDLRFNGSGYMVVGTKGPIKGKVVAGGEPTPFDMTLADVERWLEP